MLNTIRNGCAGYIDADTPYKERKRRFAEFESGQIQFLVNIRILVEGFNAPHIRSIFFLQISTSEIFIIQAIGRALRQHQDKRIATIYVPFTQESDLERIQTFIGQLSTYDERIKKSIDEKNIGGYLNIELVKEEVENDNEYDDEKEQDDVEDIFECRYNLIVDSMGNSNQYEKMFIENLQKSKNFIDAHQRRPKDGYVTINNKKMKDDSISSEEYILSRWLCTQKQNYRKESFNMKNEKIKKFWEDFINDNNYKKYMLDKNNLWTYKLEQLKKFMDEENKRPNEESKDNNEKQIGKWITQQIVYYKKKDRIMKDDNISILWEEFINDIKYKKYFIPYDLVWMSNLENVKKYIDKNNDRPTYYKGKNKEDKELGKWLDHQISKYNTKIDMVYNNDFIKQTWEEFINYKKYKSYFMTQEEKWIEKLDNCKQFIKTNKKRPNTKSEIEEERTAGYWIISQIKAYRCKCEILGITESLQKMWISFITENKKIFPAIYKKKCNA